MPSYFWIVTNVRATLLSVPTPSSTLSTQAQYFHYPSLCPISDSGRHTGERLLWVPQKINWVKKLERMDVSEDSEVQDPILAVSFHFHFFIIIRVSTTRYFSH